MINLNFYHYLMDHPTVPGIATSVLFQQSFFSVNAITHELLHLPPCNFARKSTSTTCRIL